MLATTNNDGDGLQLGSAMKCDDNAVVSSPGARAPKLWSRPSLTCRLYTRVPSLTYPATPPVAARGLHIRWWCTRNV